MAVAMVQFRTSAGEFVTGRLTNVSVTTDDGDYYASLSAGQTYEIAEETYDWLLTKLGECGPIYRQPAET